MIVCPVCGGKTQVTETRPIGASVRRRRCCMTVKCPGRVTTVEVAIAKPRDFADGAVVYVPRWQIKRLKKLVEALGGVGLGGVE